MFLLIGRVLILIWILVKLYVMLSLCLVLVVKFGLNKFVGRVND